MFAANHYNEENLAQHFTKEKIKTLKEFKIRPKMFITPEGKIMIAYSDPNHTKFNVVLEQVPCNSFTDGSFGIELEVLIVSKSFREHF